MIQGDRGSHHLEDFVEGYFRDLKQEVQQARALVEALEGKLLERLDSIAREPYLKELSRRYEAAAERDKDFSRIAEALENFASARSEEEVLDALVRYAEQTSIRALLLVRRSKSWVPFRDGKLSETDSVPFGGDTIYERAAERRAMLADESSKFMNHSDVHRILGSDASYCAAVPLIFGDTVPAVLYADVPGGQQILLPILEILCHGARLAIRALRIAEQAAPTVIVPAPQPAAEPARPLPPATVPTPMMEKSGDYTIDFSRDIAAGRNEADLAQQALQEEIESSAAFRRRFEQVDTTPALVEVETPSPPLAGPTVERAPAEAPAPVSPGEEEDRQHADARRFARLLVSELKLYNEQAVAEGRRKGDIYARLKQDIDRSREMYNRRVPSTVTRRNDYFHEELIKLLAEGEAASLGGDYPGSQTSVN